MTNRKSESAPRKVLVFKSQPPTRSKDSTAQSRSAVCEVMQSGMCFSYDVVFTMKTFILCCLIVQIFVINNVQCGALFSDTFDDEDNLQFTEDITIEKLIPITTTEDLANVKVMIQKKLEISKGGETDTFPPSQNFLTAKSEIINSDIFQFIRRMPKGGALHIHEFSMTSAEFLFDEIISMDNLYICDTNGSLSAKFFDIPTDNCKWRLLSDLRKNQTLADDMNLRIRSKLTMQVSKPNLAYPNASVVWNKYQEIFKFITPILSYRPAYEKYFYEGLKRLYEDNVFYLELRSALLPLYELNGTIHNDFKVIEIYQNISNRFMADYPDFIGVKMIYMPNRFVCSTKTFNFVNETKKFKEKFGSFFGGVDMMGIEQNRNPYTIYSERQNIIKTDSNSLAPMVESIDHTELRSDMTNSIALESKRIGHGWQFFNNTKHIKRLKILNIAIEICPIANQVLGLVKDLQDHPAKTLFRRKHPVVVCNEDPGFWGAEGLSYDFYEIFMGLMPINAGIQDLKMLALHSIAHSSMTEDEKRRAFGLWHKQWLRVMNDFVKNPQAFLKKD